MAKFNDDYDGYLAHVKNIPDAEVRKDTIKVIKWIMIKRTLIKVAEVLIISLSITGVLPSFL